MAKAKAKTRKVIIEVLNEQGEREKPPQWVVDFTASCAMARISPDKGDAMVVAESDVGAIKQSIDDDWAVGVKVHNAPRQAKGTE